MKDFEEIEHTADWALRVYGTDWAELLKNAARGMNSLLLADAESAPVEQEKNFTLEGGDREDLLVNWLSELAYWAETEQVIFHRFDFTQVSPTGLQAEVRGGRVPHLRKHIKAVTYHDLEIVETETGLAATVVFDV